MKGIPGGIFADIQLRSTEIINPPVNDPGFVSSIHRREDLCIGRWDE